MHNKQGFTLLELLVCVSILSMMTLCAIPFVQRVSFQKEIFVLNALETQCKSMYEKQECVFSSCGYDIFYSSKGHVSHADTIEIDGEIVTLQLGWGRLVEK